MATRRTATVPEAAHAGEEGKQLALSFQRGEKGAYQAIHDRYSARVDAVCRRMLGHRDDAQEAAQETFLRVYQSLGRFNGRYQLGAWITRIATNVCLDILRARGRHPENDSLDELERCGLNAEHESDPQNIVVRNAEGRHVRRVLARLSPMHRAAIVLRDFEGFSYSDVASSLGITESQAKALIHRSRGAFRRAWTSPLAALLPSGWLQRFRRIDRVKENVANVPSSGHHAAEIVTSSSQYVASCSGFLHQCGQVVSERLAPAIAAALVGGAAGVAVAHDPARVEKVVVERADAPAIINRAHRPQRERSRDARPRPAPTRAPAPASGPANEPAATPQPASTPPSKPQATPSPGEKKEEKAQPEPTGFALTFDVDSAPPEEPCSCMRETAVLSESVTANESGLSFVDQTLEGSASARGVASFGLELEHAARSDAHDLKFFLSTPEGSYAYRGQGAVVLKERTAWGGWRYVYEGTYEVSARPGYAEEMPTSGSYIAEIVVSWRQRAVISSTFTLTEG